MRFLLALVFAASGCSFEINGLALTTGDDALVSDDLFSAADAVLDDGGATDLLPTGGDGLSDLVTGHLVSHVADHHLTDGTCELTVGSTIDTTALKIDGAPAPAGCDFTTELENGMLEVAVLSVHSLRVQANVTVKVSGSRPLVVVAGNTIQIDGTLDGGAKLTVPGPGGSPTMMGAGAGAKGVHAGSFSDSGGGGAGYAVSGAAGGIGNYMNQLATPGAGGPGYGTVDLKLIAPGGSGGGTISSEMCTVTSGGGGAGGGSIQLSAGLAVTLTSRQVVFEGHRILVVDLPCRLPFVFFVFS